MLTIGYGHTKGVYSGQTITISQAHQFLLDDMAECEDFLNDQNFNLTQNEFDALTDFIFNCGAGNFKKWGLENLIKANPND